MRTPSPRGAAGGALLALGALALAAVAAPTRPARACGWESATSCSGATGAADEARWMLKRVVAAVQADEPSALRAFSRGEGGFRTQDTYVFCINAADGRMSAYPDPKLIGQDARALRDTAGRAFAAEMLDVAREDTLTELSYSFPRPDSTVPAPRTAFVTRVKDQVCGAGYYDADAAEEAEAAVPADRRLAQFRQRLEAGMPANLRPDWAAFLAALDGRLGAQEAALAKAREGVRAAETALTTAAAGPASSHGARPAASARH